MRALSVAILGIMIVSGLFALAAVKEPEKLVFTTKMGNVTFQHAKHSEYAKGDCKICHDKLWPQSAKAPLNFKEGMHKPAETKKTSCGTCHYAKGPAFSTVGNCTNSKCHVNG